MIQQKHVERGFSLLELTIVVGVLGILMAILVVTIRPTEIFRKSRDAQRISDLDVLKKTVEIFVQQHTKPSEALSSYMSGSCLTTGNTTAKIYYTALQNCGVPANVVEGADVEPGSTFDSTGGTTTCKDSATPQQIDGTGWIPLNFSGLSGGSPVSALPLDPRAGVTGVARGSFVTFNYRFVCQGTTSDEKPANVFELNTRFESDAYASKAANDGGDNDNYYEVGTSLRLLGSGTNF